MPLPSPASFWVLPVTMRPSYSKQMVRCELIIGGVARREREAVLHADSVWPGPFLRTREFKRARKADNLCHQHYQTTEQVDYGRGGGTKPRG